MSKGSDRAVVVVVNVLSPVVVVAVVDVQAWSAMLLCATLTLPTDTRGAFGNAVRPAVAILAPIRDMAEVSKESVSATHAH
jgi:hypothetical protein